MKLIDGIRITNESRIAFVGAGGKSTCMFRLAHQWQGNCIVSTSTHLAVSQTKFADHHIIIQKISDLDALGERLPQGITLLTGPLLDNQRVDGLTDEMFTKVAYLADKHQVPLLIEADGSRRLPLKAPATHEPAIPPNINTVVVVAGLRGLGKILGKTYVHRPELFSERAELEIGEEIEVSHILKLLKHPEGGLKNIDDGIQKIILLNQSDTSQLVIIASKMAKDLLEKYDEVVVSCLNKQNDEVIAKYQRVAGIILAAGGSERLGEPKQLLDWEGKPFIRTVTLNAIVAGLDPIIVVTGAAQEEVTEAVKDLDITLVNNIHWREGQSASLKVGLNKLSPRIGGVVFMLVDQPQIPVTLIKKIMETYTISKEAIIATLVDGRRGNPVLFDKRTFTELAEINGDKGGRQIFSKYAVHWVPWVDSIVGLDVDTMDDYHRLLNYKTHN